MGKYKGERAATEFENDAGSSTGGALNEVSMARRSFLGRIARWSGALAVSGLGAETWMQAVSKRSVMSSAMAAGAPRDRQLHPFPEGDPFNMPLGVNAWYAPISDPATSQVAKNVGGMNVDNGWTHPVYISTTADPLHTFTWTGNPRRGVKSYRPEEENQPSLQEHLRSDATPAPQGDGHLHLMQGNELVEFFVFRRQSPTEGSGVVIVRNRLDHYSHRGGNDPLRNRDGSRAWGGIAIAGLIRKHEAMPPGGQDPHIPHALAVMLNNARENPVRPSVHQLGIRGHGQVNGVVRTDDGSPLFDVEYMFPADMRDTHGYPGGGGSCRMGMRFALDPSIATDSWINAITNLQHRAIARALRDYGMIAVDAGFNRNVLYGEIGITGSAAQNMKGWGWMAVHLRRVAGAGPVHNPTDANWQTWRNARQGWGGGAPRVPYSPPLSSAVPPQSPRKIEVTESRRFGDTA